MSARGSARGDSIEEKELLLACLACCVGGSRHRMAPDGDCYLCGYTTFSIVIEKQNRSGYGDLGSKGISRLIGPAHKMLTVSNWKKKAAKKKKS